jgi:Uncharacterized protein conserved in bacteria (DUF2252)
VERGVGGIGMVRLGAGARAREVWRCSDDQRYLGSNSRFDKAIAQFALAYADQNERDYKTLLKAMRDGRIQTLGE